MMYHRDVIIGESPDRATVNAAPLLPYEGFPCAVKLSELPAVKSMFTDFPSAESGGHDVEYNGLQFDHVWDIVGLVRIATMSELGNDNIDQRILLLCKKMWMVWGLGGWYVRTG
jgi:hypothetical protein